MSEEVVTKPPRSQAELDQRYTELCTHLGDRLHKQDLLGFDIQAIKNEIAKVDAESRELIKQKAEIEKHNNELAVKKAAKKAKAAK